MIFFFLICGTVLVYIRNPEMRVCVYKFLNSLYFAKLSTLQGLDKKKRRESFKSSFSITKKKRKELQTQRRCR